MSPGRTARTLVVAVFLLVVVATPVFELCSGRWPGAGLRERYTFRELLAGRQWRAVETRLERDCAIARIVRPAYNLALFRLFREVNQTLELGADGWLFLGLTVRGYPPPNARRIIDETAELFQELSEWYAGHGTRLLVLMVPNKATLHPEKVAHLRPRFEPSYGWISQKLREAGAWTIDLRRALDPAEGETYLSYDTHWRPEGAHRAAVAVAEEIRRSFGDSPVPGAVQGGRIQQMQQIQHPGGLYPMLGFPEGSALESRFMEVGAELRAVDEHGHPIDTSGPLDLVLVGTSFSAAPFHFAALLSVELKRRVEDRSIIGRGPTRAVLDLAEAIAGGERAAPGLVIWEFPERYMFESILQMQEPLRAFLSGIDYGESRPLPVRERTTGRLKWSEREDGSLDGAPDPKDPWILYELSEPLPGDGSLALTYAITADQVTASIVSFDLGEGFDELLDVQTIVPRRRETTHVVVPIRMPEDAPVKRLRITPVRGRAPFHMTPPELRTRRAP